MIDLYYYPSPNVRKIVMALEELGLPYGTHWVDITAGDQFSEDYVAINPNAKVPSIVDHDGPDGATITVFETAAILLYLAEKTGRLLPDDPSRRWTAIAWTAWQVANHGPMTGQATHFLTYAPQQGVEDPYATERYRTEVTRLYGVLEGRLRDREYLADEFSIADIACFPWVRVAKGHAVDLREYPAISSWVARIAERPCAQVKLTDPRDPADGATRNVYDADQFALLFRSGAAASAPAPSPEQVP